MKSLAVFLEPIVRATFKTLLYYSETPAEETEPIVEEPVTPEADEAPAEPESAPEAVTEDEAAEASEDEKAEPDLTDEE